MVPFQVILGLRPDLQHIQERDLLLLVLVRLPELQELLHFVAIQFHPLSPELNQGCFRVDELLPFLFRDYLAPNRELVLVGDDCIETEIAISGRCCSLRRTLRAFEADLRAPPPLPSPPPLAHHPLPNSPAYPAPPLQERHP